MNKENSTKQSQTNWAKIDAIPDEDIDFTDCPEITDEMWATGVLRKGSKSVSTNSQETLTVDGDVIEFFKAREPDYKAKINQLLRAYMEAHRAK
jgi:uncharacterized protein (DUF4415 family)